MGGEVVVPGIVALGAALLGCCPPAEALALVQRNEAALAAAAAAPGGGGGGGGAAAAAAAEAAAGGLQGRGSAGLQSALLGIELLQVGWWGEKGRRKGEEKERERIEEAGWGGAGCRMRTSRAAVPRTRAPPGALSANDTSRLPSPNQHPTATQS